MSDMKFFQSNNGFKCRVFIRDGEPWFVAKDVCENIGLNDVSRACAPLDDDEKITLSKKQLPENFSGSQNAYHFLVISEPGMYSLVMRSNKPEASKFQRWVTHDVLPAIRKHGVYATPGAVQSLSSEELMARAVLAAQSTIERLEKEKAAEKAIAEAMKAERDKAIQDKSHISAGREAKLMGKVSGLSRQVAVLTDENNSLKDELIKTKSDYTVAEIPWRKKYFHDVPYRGTLKVGVCNRIGTVLQLICRERGVDPSARKVLQGGKWVNQYRKEITDLLEAYILGKDEGNKYFRMLSDYLKPAYR